MLQRSADKRLVRRDEEASGGASVCACVYQMNTHAPHTMLVVETEFQVSASMCVWRCMMTALTIFSACECANHLSVFVVVLQQSSMLPDVLSSLLVGSRFQVAGVLSPMKHFRCEMVKN